MHLDLLRTHLERNLESTGIVDSILRFRRSVNERLVWYSDNIVKIVM